MCFETTKSAKAKIAKTDIECWKFIKKNGYSMLHKRAPFACKYIKGAIMPKVNLIKIDTWSGYEIHEGYHSNKTRTGLITTWVVDDDDKVCKFIIPKGARYYSNKTEYVSETIMLVE